ncbi:MAG: hypothetical protein LBR41_00325, partial [Rickettsiales bacterium]|nr:hypothetical protein [Rickettsiales bacterium]
MATEIEFKYLLPVEEFPFLPELRDVHPEIILQGYMPSGKFWIEGARRISIVLSDNYKIQLPPEISREFNRRMRGPDGILASDIEFRFRQIDDGDAIATVKGASGPGGMSRAELSFPITSNDVRAMHSNGAKFISKARYKIGENPTLEIDNYLSPDIPFISVEGEFPSAKQMENYTVPFASMYPVMATGIPAFKNETIAVSPWNVRAEYEKRLRVGFISGTDDDTRLWNSFVDMDSFINTRRWAELHDKNPKI